MALFVNEPCALARFGAVAAQGDDGCHVLRLEGFRRVAATPPVVGHRPPVLLCRQVFGLPKAGYFPSGLLRTSLWAATIG